MEDRILNIEDLKNSMLGLNFRNNGSVKLSFVEKRKNGITSFVPEISKSLRENIVEMYLRVLDYPVFQYEQQPYNELGKIDDVLDVATLEVGKIDSIINQINFEENRCHNLSEIKLDKINYYVVNFNLSGENFYFFRRFNKQKKLRKGVRGHFTGNNFVQLEDEVVGIDEDIDIIVYQEEALIINRYALQTIFDISDYFSGKTDQAMEVIKGYKKINNFATFERDCKNDGTATKRLTKIVNTPELINGFFNHIHQLPNVIKDMSLVIQMDSNGNIDYKGTREERTQILSCIADKYYITLLQGKLGEDKLK